MNIGVILDQIDLGSMALPEFQRGYVWNRDQVRGLMESLYRKHPVGGLLVWLTKTEDASARGDGSLAPGIVKLLLDGQQRITSLYGIIRGKPPKFFGSRRESDSTPVIQAAFPTRRTARNSTLVTATRLAFSSRYRRFL